MADDEYDIHPLDRDYSEPVKPAKRKATSIDSKLHRIGLFTFAAGFITVVLAAIVSGASSPGSPIETIGSYLHRFAMVIILVGGVLIIAAYRVPKLKGKIRMPNVRKTTATAAPGSFGLLLVVNGIVFALLFPLAGFLRSIGSTEWYFLLINGIMTITAAWMVTLAVWHRGMLRAFAIGILVAMVFNFFSGMIGFTGRYGRPWAGFMMMGHFATIQISGLVCAGYVYMIESFGGKAAEPAE